MPVPEHEQTEQVNKQAQTACVQQQVDILEFMRLEKALDRFDDDAQAHGAEEDGVDEGSKHFGTHPSIGVLGTGAF